MTEALTNWTDFQLNEINGSYGIKWPNGTSQLSKELLCFYSIKRGEATSQMLTAFDHGLNIVRLLFPSCVEIYKDTKWGRIWNTYFLDVFKECCYFEPVIFSGPASSAKTFAVSCFSIINLICAPDKTLVMLSTTSGTASERRIWGNIKDLHRDAKWDENSTHPIGEVIEYLKCVVFDYAKQAKISDKNERDFRNSISVIPISNDSQGESALDTIMGSKNKNVLWVIDELPAMMDGVERPCVNLEFNEFFQYIGIGNAYRKSDVHGRSCEPSDGWTTVSGKHSCRWKSKSGRRVLFLHGEQGPNDDPRIDQSEIKNKTDYPFPYLSNRLAREKNAFSVGRGDMEYGRKTIDYMRFSIGFWSGSNVFNTVISEEYVKAMGAHNSPRPWAYGPRRIFCGADFAFTCGGDGNELAFATFGYNIDGNPQIVFESETINISPTEEDGSYYRMEVAKETVKECLERKMQPQDFGCDIMNEGGLTRDDIQTVWKRRGQVGISSLGSATNEERYTNKVSEIWMKVPELLALKICYGFNISSGYASQLFERQYDEHNKKIQVEPKDKMKKRIKVSPDKGDAFAYMCYMIMKSGVVASEAAKFQEKKKQLDDTINGKKETPNEEVSFVRHSQLTEKYQDYSMF